MNRAEVSEPLKRNPVIEVHGGLAVNAEADDLYCLLESVDGAVAAARELIGRLDRDNLGCGYPDLGSAPAKAGAPLRNRHSGLLLAQEHEPIA